MIDDVPTSATPPRSARRAGAVSRLVAGLVVVVGASVLAACGDDGNATRDAGPGPDAATTSPAATATTTSVDDEGDAGGQGAETCPAPEGALADFGAVELALAPASGAGDDDDGAGRGRVCLLLADDPGLRQQGLMGVTDLGPFDGMLFAYAGSSTGGYWMRGTPLPLSIAWISPEGEVVGTADMEPCLDAGNSCPTYDPAGAYRWAIEVPRGELADLGLDTGARLDVSDWPVGAD